MILENLKKNPSEFDLGFQLGVQKDCLDYLREYNISIDQVESILSKIKNNQISFEDFINLIKDFIEKNK